MFASRTETQGLVLLEALALGVPVVSTAVIGTADVLKGVQGALVAPDDVDGFAAAVTRVLTDPALRQRLAAAAPADAAAWSAGAMAERLVALYREVIGAAAPPYSGARPLSTPNRHADRVAPSDARRVARKRREADAGPRRQARERRSTEVQTAAAAPETRRATAAARESPRAARVRCRRVLICGNIA